MVPTTATSILWRPPPLFFTLPGPARRLLTFFSFRRQLRSLARRYQPQLLVCYMYHALAAGGGLKRQFPGMFFLGGIVDIVSLRDAGLLDRWLIPIGTRALQQADAVWSSDPFKAGLTARAARLKRAPIVCYNCPTLAYLSEPTWPRDGWLRNELRKQGATIGETGGSILLRAGAVGESGGIEETLEGMESLPADYIFVMMGRPAESYKNRLANRIEKLNLRQRAFLWDRPSDEIWQKALQGADIGHLVHGPFRPGRMMRSFELNSSLSNNRLFQYMAAGLPIIAYDDPRMSALYSEVPCFRVTRLASLGADIRAAWRELGGDPDSRHQLGKAGRKAHMDKYCWEKQFGPIQEAVNDCVMA